MIFGLFQVGWALFRPHVDPIGEASSLRLKWELIHRWTGRLLPWFAFINMFIGLSLINASGGVIGLIIIWFSALVLFVIVTELRRRNVIFNK